MKIITYSVTNLLGSKLKIQTEMLFITNIDLFTQVTHDADSATTDIQRVHISLSVRKHFNIISKSARLFYSFLTIMLIK